MEKRATSADQTGLLAGRKKRKRRTAGGAQDDCFTCRQRATRCDRQRPYCSQCIDLGKECSGYKTTLTWGVGVASRGKLRGLSLPITSSDNSLNPSQLTEQSSTLVQQRDRSTVHDEIESASATDDEAQTRPQYRQQVTSHPITIKQETSTTSQPSTSIQHDLQWTAPSMPSTPSMCFKAQNLTAPISRSVLRLQTSLPASYDSALYTDSASSTGSFFDADYFAPATYPPRYHSCTTSASDYADSSTDQELEADLHLLDEHFVPQDEVHYTLPTPSPFQYSSSALVHRHEDEDLPEDQDFEAAGSMMDHTSAFLSSMTFMNPLPDISPRIRYLMQYYDVNICPFLVAVDGPQNPYRQQIIQMAVQHDGLQNAIAALALNNIRMRKLLPAQSSGDLDPQTIESPTHEPSAEESLYKKLSVDRLNQQLLDPVAAQDESVLATLLILCLFHVCDSGFSKFRTQLAGVQKLLSLRPSHQRSLFANWVEMFFMWFDVMTAAVNDRETEMTGTSLDMLDYTLGLGALEQFSGCDGRLFKLIARLSRLNLLAQGRPVAGTEEHVADQSPLPKASMTSSPTQHRPAQAAGRAPLTAKDFESLDGNGWRSHVHPASSRDWPSHLPPPPDSRRQFWLEWHDIRSHLVTWHVESAMTTWSLSGIETARLSSEQGDMLHISEAFRHSALLYTERLAHPLLPSTSYRFQQHVSRALMHITALPVTSCVNKFLLWPLFITGTECVDESHRATIRLRCVEIQRESGFYNNLSGLEVLERVWADVDIGRSDASEMKARRRDSESARVGPCRQAFRWRIAMDRADGEYLII